MVRSQNRKRNLLLSAFTLFGAVAMSFFIFYPSTSDLGKGFTVAIFYTISRYVFIGLALLVFALRLLKILSRFSYWYIMPAIFNLFIGILAIILYLSGNAERSWLNLCLINLLIGFILIVDVYLYSYIFDSTN